MLSISATFAADDNVDAVVIDEIDDGEPLAIDEDSQALSEGDVVTNDTFYNYFDASGSLLANVTSTELTFKGDIADVGVDEININRPIKITGDNATITNLVINVDSSDVVISGLTINQDKDFCAILVYNATNVQIEKTTINFEAVADGAAIDAELADNLILIDNTINYLGTTNGSTINNGIRVFDSNGATIKGNKFYLFMNSVPVVWEEIPAGSGNWVSFPASEGILIESSDDVIFKENEVELNYINASGSYDTIYTVDFKNSDGALIEGNTIVANGHSYIYGIIISGQNFIISENLIETESDICYANGIDIEGPATGIVNDNAISVSSVQSAYAIYSGMNGANVSVGYYNNEIEGTAYNIFGFSLGDVESYLYKNTVMLNGNYSTGIAYRGENIEIGENQIVLTSSEVGNESIWEGFGVEAVGVKVIKGDVSITNSTIATPGKGVSFEGPVNAYLADNFINVVGNDDENAYAIYADEIGELEVTGNTIDYQGLTKGTGINNAVFVFNTTDAYFSQNNFILDLVSCYVPWVEIPTGSGNWVSFPISEGIVFDSSDYATFEENTVELTYGDISGSYDTIYTVSFKDSDDVVINKNNITAKGHTYIYGIQISGQDFTIIGNDIAVESDNYYANGIDIEGPASGLVNLNVISVNSIESAYAIYSGMNGEDVTAGYVNNEINGNAYNVFGFSLGDVESYLYGNTVMLDGNYSTGVAFRGDVIELIDNRIVLTSSEVGNESIWEGFGVEAVGVKVVKGNLTLKENVIATPGTGVEINGIQNVDIENNFINVVANDDKDAAAIAATYASNVTISNNTIDYQGTTEGDGLNYGIFLYETDLAKITGNKFYLELVSCYVPWAEVPTGSGNWVSSPVSEGILIENSKDVVFSDNEVNVNYGDVSGLYDTIYAVDFDNCTDINITGNDIEANGHTYIYGIIISSKNFLIDDNSIYSTSDNYYANGIDVEGPATGVIFGNEIHATGVSSAYPIYSGMNGQNVSVSYINNDIYGDAYLVIGMSLGDVESYIVNNCIYVDGNYTKGIASKVADLYVVDNLIVSSGSNVGNESAWEAFGVDTYGIKVVAGDALIANNTIRSTSDYAISIAAGVTGSIVDNDLVANNVGRSAIDVATNISISGSGPTYKIIILAHDLTKAYDSATQFVVTVVDENGNPVVNKTLVLTMGVELVDVAATNANGVARFNAYLPVGTHTVKVSYDGDDVYGPKEATSKIVVTKAATKITATKKTFSVKTKTKKYAVTVKANNKALGSVKVTIKVNGKTYIAKTNAKGKATFKITKLNKKGSYKAVVKFAGNGSYKASSAKAVITVK